MPSFARRVIEKMQQQQGLPQFDQLIINGASDDLSLALVLVLTCL
jgi:hypothetical protein